MGRAFEYRKARKMKRWGHMARVFTKIGKEIEIAEKENITNPIIVTSRRSKLDVWKKHMDKDPKIRLLYADKYFSISNYADYANCGEDS